MGTRSLTVFKERDEEIVVLYRQFDGYLDGHGKDLKEILSDYKIVNGYTLEDEHNKVANGMGCLAMQVTAQLYSKLNKDKYENAVKYKKALENKEVKEPESFLQGPNQLHLCPAGTRDCWEEYVYTIYDKEEKLFIKVEQKYENKVLFDGLVEDFKPEIEY